MGKVPLTGGPLSPPLGTGFPAFHLNTPQYTEEYIKLSVADLLSVVNFLNSVQVSRIRWINKEVSMRESSYRYVRISLKK
jgi:hypothetical protein